MAQQTAGRVPPFSFCKYIFKDFFFYIYEGFVCMYVSALMCKQEGMGLIM